MRLPLPSVIVNGGMNALYQQMLNNQILASKAQYSQQLAQAQAQQAQGQAQNSLAQGRFAPQFYQGQANEATGLGQIELAQAPYAGRTAQANMLNAQLQPGATQAGINLTQAEQQNVGNTALQVPANAAANRALTLAQAYRQQNPNATFAQALSWAYQNLPNTFNAIGNNLSAAIAPSAGPASSPVPSSSSTQPSSSGTISYQGKVYPYTKTRVVNGQEQVFIPALNGWGL